MQYQPDSLIYVVKNLKCILINIITYTFLCHLSLLLTKHINILKILLTSCNVPPHLIMQENLCELLSVENTNIITFTS